MFVVLVSNILLPRSSSLWPGRHVCSRCANVLQLETLGRAHEAQAKAAKQMSILGIFHYDTIFVVTQNSCRCCTYETIIFIILDILEKYTVF